MHRFSCYKSRIFRRYQKRFTFVILFFILLIIYSSFHTTRLFIQCRFFEKTNDAQNDLDIYAETSEREIDFQKDVLALMHIQKTSGTNLENIILNNLLVNINGTWKRACQYLAPFKRIMCMRNIHSKPFFWDRHMAKFCDIHADYTELKNCIMHDYSNRIKIPYLRMPFYGIIHFITMLRNPIERYISEFYHVKRGGTWSRSVRTCKEELLFQKNCSNSKNWKNTTWSEFLSCEHNLANNRQTRMLANYNQLGCRILKCWTKKGGCTVEQKRKYDKILLESAKQTLLSISFFGLTEYQSLSQYLFEKTFKEKMKFSEPFIDTARSNYEMKDEYKSVEIIRKNNHLDIELYKFAERLFNKRLKYFRDRNIS